MKGLMFIILSIFFTLSCTTGAISEKDKDGDGYVDVKYGGSDCEDGNSDIWRMVNVYIDSDGDGYDAGKEDVCMGESLPSGYSLNSSGTDCNDNNINENLICFFWSYTTGGGVGSSPSIADIDSDGKLEVVFGSDDYKIYALSTGSPVPSPSLLPWTKFKHDIKNTGFYTGNPNPPW